VKPVEGRAILPTPGIVEIETVNGEKFTKRVDFVKGHFKNPNSLEDCIEKMRACIEYGGLHISKNRMNQLQDLLLGMEKIEDIRQLVLLLK